METFPIEFQRADADTLRARAPCGCGWIVIGADGAMSFEPDADTGAIQLDQAPDEQTFTREEPGQ